MRLRIIDLSTLLLNMENFHNFGDKNKIVRNHRIDMDLDTMKKGVFSTITVTHLYSIIGDMYIIFTYRGWLSLLWD